MDRRHRLLLEGGGGGSSSSSLVGGWNPVGILLDSRSPVGVGGGVISTGSPLRQEEHTQITHPYKYFTAASAKYDTSKDHDERTRGMAQRM